MSIKLILISLLAVPRQYLTEAYDINLVVVYRELDDPPEVLTHPVFVEGAGFNHGALKTNIMKGNAYEGRYIFQRYQGACGPRYFGIGFECGETVRCFGRNLSRTVSLWRTLLGIDVRCFAPCCVA